MRVLPVVWRPQAQAPTCPSRGSPAGGWRNRSTTGQAGERSEIPAKLCVGSSGVMRCCTPGGSTDVNDPEKANSENKKRLHLLRAGGEKETDYETNVLGVRNVF